MKKIGTSAVPTPDPLPAHPATNVFPMMTEDDLADLAADIEAHGLLSRPVTWINPADGVEYLLDGRNRIAACAMVARNSAGDISDTAASGFAFSDRERVETDDPFAYVVSANVRRRHLTPSQRRKIAADLLRAKPERSDRSTAKIAGVSDKTVAPIRAELEERAEIPHADTRTDTKGRRQPAAKVAKAQARATTTRRKPDRVAHSTEGLERALRAAIETLGVEAVRAVCLRVLDAVDPRSRC